MEPFRDSQVKLWSLQLVTEIQQTNVGMQNLISGKKKQEQEKTPFI